MKVQIPEEWKKEELIKTTTAYGNEVMIPKRYTVAWEAQRKAYEGAKTRGIDISIGVESLEISMSMSRPKKNMLMVFYEKYKN